MSTELATPGSVEPQTAEMMIMRRVIECTGGRVRNLHVELSSKLAHVDGRVSSYLVKGMADQAARDAIHALIDLVASPRFRPAAIEAKFVVDDASAVNN
jgi:hypothetical protein